jgi:tetratricopeptide (TPR) repeat protein
MKKKCPLCGNGKPKRQCMIKGNEAICCKCCAEQRGAPCDGCIHYTVAMRYQAERKTATEPPEGHYIIEINPELEEAVEDALDRAMAGKLDKALKMLQRLERDNHPDYNVYYGLGTAHGLKGNQEEAVCWLKKSIGIFPYSAETYYNLGVAYQKLFDIGNTVKAYRKVLLYGDAEEPYYRQAEDSLTNAAAVIRKNHGIDLDAYLVSQNEFDQAFAWMENGEFEQALSGFRQAVAVNENNVSTHGNMGLCLAILGYKAEALAELDRALEIDPDYEPAITNRVAVERMKEGEPLTGVGFETTNSAEVRTQYRTTS